MHLHSPQSPDFWSCSSEGLLTAFHPQGALSLQLEPQDLLRALCEACHALEAPQPAPRRRWSCSGPQGRLLLSLGQVRGELRMQVGPHRTRMLLEPRMLLDQLGVWAALLWSDRAAHS